MENATNWGPLQSIDLSSLNREFSQIYQSQSSLTTALKAIVKQSFAIQLLHQSWMQHDLQENEAVFVREVFSVGDNIPWVYGRSIIPKTTYFAEPKIQTLQLKPLGEILFDSRRIIREPFVFSN